MLSRAAVAADLDGLAEAWAWTPDDTLVHGLPLFHVHGLVLGVLGALRVGSRLDPHRQADTAGVRRGRRHDVLRRADGVVADLRRPGARPGAARRAAARVGQRPAARGRVRARCKR